MALSKRCIDPLGTADAGSGRIFYYEEFVKGVKKPRRVQIGNLAPQVVATQSGGRVLSSNNDITGEIAACMADANAFYVLTLTLSWATVPTNTSPSILNSTNPD